MAGISGVQHARNATNMTGSNVEAPDRVSTSFLSASHFSLEQDPCVTKQCQYSVFTKDYPPWDVSCKPKPAIPPPNVGVLGEDARFFNQRASETKSQYDYVSGQKQVLPDPYSKLQATNFKMHGDNEKILPKDSTQHEDYTPKTSDDDALARRAATQLVQQASCIPQGDKDKADKPLSDYADRYRQHDPKDFSAKAENLHQGPATILGDDRSHAYETSHNSAYRGPIQAKEQPVQTDRFGSNLAMGDPINEKHKLTVHQASYLPYDVTGPKTMPARRLMRSNITHADGHGKWDNYSTTFSDSYRPSWEEADPYRRASGSATSNFPTGDEDPYRNGERANVTSNRLDYTPKWVDKQRVVKPNEESQVVMGDPSLAKDFYETTHNTNFSAPNGEPAKPSTRLKSTSVLADYQTNDASGNPNTMYQSDFLLTNQGKMKLDQEAINRMCASHIRPQTDQFYGSTEHRDQFIPLPYGKLTFKPGRLQLSSVPLGTLQQDDGGEARPSGVKSHLIATRYTDDACLRTMPRDQTDMTCQQDTLRHGDVTAPQLRFTEATCPPIVSNCP